MHWSDKLVELLYGHELSDTEIAFLRTNRVAGLSPDRMVEGRRITSVAKSEITGILQEYAKCDLRAHTLSLECYYGYTRDMVDAVLPQLWAWADEELAKEQKAKNETTQRLWRTFQQLAQLASKEGVVLERADIPRKYSGLGLTHCCGIVLSYWDRDLIVVYSEPKFGRFWQVEDE